MRWPSSMARWAMRAQAGSVTFRPSTKKVVFRLCPASASSTEGVTSGSGPLSKVRVTLCTRYDFRVRVLGGVGHHRVDASFDVDGTHFAELEVSACRHICVFAHEDADAHLLSRRFQPRCEVHCVANGCVI